MYQRASGGKKFRTSSVAASILTALSEIFHRRQMQFDDYC